MRTSEWSLRIKSTPRIYSLLCGIFCKWWWKKYYEIAHIIHTCDCSDVEVETRLLYAVCEKHWALSNDATTGYEEDGYTDSTVLVYEKSTTLRSMELSAHTLNTFSCVCEVLRFVLIFSLAYELEVKSFPRNFHLLRFISFLMRGKFPWKFSVRWKIMEISSMTQ